jgi:ligand-binding SRPBCC domain-containing protein
MRDRVIYKLPLGLLGDIFAHWKVAKDVKMIFQYRRVAIDKIFNRNDR